MKLNLDPDVLKMPLEDIIKEALQNARNIKEKIYLALMYFQYINRLSTNKAVILFKEYILSDGQKSSYPITIYYKDSMIKSIQVPLKIDEFLSRFLPEIMNHKDLVSRMHKNKYIKFVKNYLKINASDITAHAIYKMINDIGIHNLIALNKHWALLSRKIIPYVIKNGIQI